MYSELGVGWCSYDASTGLPPRPRGRRPRGLIWTALGGCGRAERRCGRERRRGVQKPLAACQGKRFPSRFSLRFRGEVYPAGCHSSRRREVPEAYGGGRAAPNSWQRGRRSRVGAGFESEGRDLVHPVAGAQSEVVKRTANDGVGAVVQGFERRYVAVSPHEHHRSAGKVIRQPRRRLAGGGSVVSGNSMFGSTQCLRKLLKKSFGRKFW